MSLEVKELLIIAEKRLADAGCGDPKVDAELLMCHLLRFDRSALFMNWSLELNDKICDAYFGLVDIRASRKPLQYMIGRQMFMGIMFRVDKRVLIPRQDTETLVETLLDHMKSESGPVGGRRILDLGTGSGAIAVSLCRLCAGVKVTATDVSAPALVVAHRNALAANVEKSIKFIESDMFSRLKSGFGGTRFHIIVSNPPYIRSGEFPDLQKEIVDYEPRTALDGGEDGLNAYRVIAAQAHLFLKKRGLLALEIGADQANAVSELLSETERYEEPAIIKDAAGKDRVLLARVK